MSTRRRGKISNPVTPSLPIAASTATPEPMPGSSEAMDESVVSVFYSNGLIGISCYNQTSLDVRMLRHVPDHGYYLYRLEQLLSKLQPSTIVISRTAHRDLENTIVSFANFFNEVTVAKVPPQHMQPMVAEQELLSLDLKGRPGTPFSACTSEEKLAYLRHHLDFKQEKSMRSLGGLLYHLKRLHQGTDASFVNTVGMAEASDRLSVPMQTLRDLHIVAPKSRQADALRKRDGLSVVSLFGRHCSIGLQRLRSMFASPFCELRPITERLNLVAYFVRHHELCDRLQRTFANIRRVDRMFVNMTQTQTSVAEWKTLRDTCEQLLLVSEAFSSAPNAPISAETRDAVGSASPYAVVMLRMINGTIDFDAFKENSSFRNPVREGICPELDKIKKLYFGSVSEKLATCTTRQLALMPLSVTEGRVLYVPCFGFVFATSLANAKLLDQLKGVRRLCKMDTLVLFRTPIVDELNDLYGDMHNRIINREGVICRELQRQALAGSWQLLKAIDQLCTLDAVLALAATARNQGFTRPNITLKNLIIVKNGYHPLLEFNKPLNAAHVKPNSFMSVDGQLVHVITGANSSGKTVFLRQNAIIALLAHVGSFVPAQASKIALLQTIRTSFFVTETVQHELSSFALQCRQVAAMEKSADAGRSLLLIDEFGKGTVTTEGAALCVAVLDALAQHPNKPHVLLATHYSRHLRHFLKRNPLVAFATFRYHIEQGNLVQLHELRKGVSSRSFASFAAAQAGLPDDLITTQEQISKSFKGHGNVDSVMPISAQMLAEFVGRVFTDVQLCLEAAPNEF